MQMSTAVLPWTLFPDMPVTISTCRVMVVTVFRYSRSMLRFKTDFEVQTRGSESKIGTWWLVLT